jgi:hypothetical protein
MREPYKYETHVLSSKASCHHYASHETSHRGPKFAGTECRQTEIAMYYITLWIGTWHEVPVCSTSLYTREGKKTDADMNMIRSKDVTFLAFHICWSVFMGYLNKLNNISLACANGG